MKLGKYILGLALVAAGLTSCDQENISAIYEPSVANISFLTGEQSALTDKTSIEVPVAVGRAMTNGSYTATVTMSDASEGVSLKSNQVTFVDGEGMAYATVVITGMEQGYNYSCTLSLSDADKQTANTEFGEQITSTKVVVMCDYNWIPAGTCTFFDYTFGDGEVGENVPIQNGEGSNVYRIISPYTYVYPDDGAPAHKITFYLNNDGSISMKEGDWFTLWGYGFYYDTADWGNYCYVQQEGNLYDVCHLLKVDGAVTYTAEFAFQWDR